METGSSERVSDSVLARGPLARQRNLDAAVRVGAWSRADRSPRTRKVLEGMHEIVIVVW